MPNYHVNSKTGKAGVCNATEKRGCPLGEYTPHFPSKHEANEYIEKIEQLNNAQFSVTKKATKASNVDHEPSEAKNSASASSSRNQSELSPSAPTVANSEIHEKNNFPEYTNQGEIFHNSPKTAANIVEDTYDPQARPEPYYTLNTKSINPVKRSGAADWLVESNTSFVIVSKRDGSGARAIFTHDNDNENFDLGQPVIQHKQQSNSRDLTSGLYVVGSIDSRGNKIGYVPDKGIQSFVFK